MTTYKKVKVCFLLIFIFFNFFYVAPCYSLSLREDLFKNALDLSSVGQFNLALEEWNLYLDSYPDDAAGFSNRGNVRLVLGDDSSMLEFVVEPYLIQIGFLTKTARGRLLTALGKKYIDSKNDNF